MEKPVNFQERVFQLFERNQTNSSEFKTYLMIFGRNKLVGLYEKFKEEQSNRKSSLYDSHEHDEGWIILNPEEIPTLQEQILEYGSELPGGAQYVRLKSTVQNKQEELIF